MITNEPFSDRLGSVSLVLVEQSLTSTELTVNKRASQDGFTDSRYGQFQMSLKALLQ
jgi:hypothetical protein